MSSYDLDFLGKRSAELGFVRDTFEKVARLADVLEYLNTNPILKDNLALKGGTAINLTIFDLPRLSVDIDLDYLINNSREEMLSAREVIKDTILKYMLSQAYSISPKTKNPHSLDSWIFNYQGASGNRDNIKIEINYSLRSHIYEAEERPIITEVLAGDYMVKSLTSLEIFASKINALLSRAAVRDLYDVRNMIRFATFDKSEEKMLRKCVVFYAAVSAKEINKSFDTRTIDAITKNKVKRELLPVIRTKDDFELESARRLVKEYIADLMVLEKEEKEFLDEFEGNRYIPGLLFQDEEILNRIRKHPMALWKTVVSR